MITKDRQSLVQYQDRVPERGDVLRFKMISSFCEGKVLDAGCGTAVLEKYLQKNEGIKYIGLDTDGNVDIHASIYQIPFKENSFNTVVISEVLEHLEHPAAALKELARVSRENIIITVPNPWNINQILSLSLHGCNLREPNHIALFGDNEIERLGKRAQLRLDRIERFYIPIPRTKRHIPIRSKFGEWNLYVLKK